MEDVNLMCEILNCGKRAVAFGIKESTRVRSCEDHVTSLLSKSLQICDIKGYSFIFSLHDVVEFEERKILRSKGCGNLDVLEVNCDAELVTALQAIERAKKNVMEAIEQQFEEIKVEVTETCKAIKNQLKELQSTFEQFTTSKENQLSPMAELVCGNLEVVPKLLRFDIADVSSHCSAALSESWAVSTDLHSALKCLDGGQNKEAIESALAEASVYAKKGIHTALCYVDLLTEEFNKPQMQVISELLELEKSHFDENLRWLQHSWDLRQRYEFPDCASSKIGQQLATLLCFQYGDFSAAEKILRSCYETAQIDNPLSEESMSLCTGMCGVYAACAQNEQTEATCQWTLESFAAADCPSEYYWTVLFYLTDSLRLRERCSDAYAIFDLWREFRVDSKLSEMLQLLICGSMAYDFGDKEEALKWLSQARRIGTTHFPVSIFTGLTFSRLAWITAGAEREQLCKYARSIFDVTAPKTCYAAMNLTYLCESFTQQDNFAEARECYRQALSIYESVTPKSVYSAVNLCKMAAAFEEKKLWEEAADCRQQAWIIYESSAPCSADAASNLTKMGVSYKKREQWTEAEMCYRKAQAIIEAIAPKSISAAENLTEIGIVLHKKGQVDEAIAFHQQACSIFEQVAPECLGAAENLTEVAFLLNKRERFREAVECRCQAQSIYEATAPKSIDAAINLTNLGVLLNSRGQWNDAEKCYQQARSLYEVAGPQSVHAATNLMNLGISYCNVKRWSEAENYLLQAQTIYEIVGQKFGKAANNFYHLGRVYQAIGQNARAIEYFQKAVLIYTENGNEKMKSNVELEITLLISKSTGAK